MTKMTTTAGESEQSDDSRPHPGWTGYIRFAGDKRLRLDPEAIALAEQVLDERSPVLRFWEDAFAVSFGVSGVDAVAAHADLELALKNLEADLDLPRTLIAEVRVTSNDHLEREISKLPHVGVTEAAEILGVSKQRVAQLAKRSDFPEPAFRLRATPVWREDELRRFASTRRTTPGAPRRRDRAR